MAGTCVVFWKRGGGLEGRGQRHISVGPTALSAHILHELDCHGGKPSGRLICADALRGGASGGRAEHPGARGRSLA